MLCLCFSRQRTLYVPVLGIGEDGRHRHSGEVLSAPLADQAGVRRMLRAAIERGNPALPGTVGDDAGERALWLAAGVADRAAFEREALGLYIAEQDGLYRLAPRRRPTETGWEPPPAAAGQPPLRGIDEVLDRIAGLFALDAATSTEAPRAARPDPEKSKVLRNEPNRSVGRVARLVETLRRRFSPPPPPPPPANGFVAEMVEAAQWMAARLPQLGCRGDFSLDSLKDIDRLLDETIADGQPRPGGPFVANFGTQMLALAAYVGEVIRRSRGSRWQWQGDGYKDAKDETINIRMRRDDGARCWPVQRLLKRVRNGSEDGLFVYALVLLDKGEPARLEAE